MTSLEVLPHIPEFPLDIADEITIGDKGQLRLDYHFQSSFPCIESMLDSDIMLAEILGEPIDSVSFSTSFDRRI